jgi:hypothetical protein
VRKAIGMMVISGALLLLWRLLANSAAGDVFSARAVRYVQGIGWLLILGSVTASLGLLVSTTGGYDVEMFGAGPGSPSPIPHATTRKWSTANTPGLIRSTVAKATATLLVAW